MVSTWIFPIHSLEGSAAFREGAAFLRPGRAAPPRKMGGHLRWDSRLLLITKNDDWMNF